MKSSYFTTLFISTIAIACTALPTHAATKIPVPFTSQAPYGNWAEPWQNACEEATIAMVDAYYTNDNFSSPAHARDEILHIFDLKEQMFGYSLDETVDVMTAIINTHLSWHAYTVDNPSIAQIKAEIDAKRPVILPASGVELSNPFFHSDPNYHTVVITGYDDDTREFITHEPGTQHGLDFRYSYDKIIASMHDFLPNWRTPEGKKVTIFTNATFQTDITLENGTLARLPTDPKVYLFANNTLFHIADGQTFHRLGWRGDMIRIVNDVFIDRYAKGPQISMANVTLAADLRTIESIQLPTATRLILPPGILVKSPKNPKVYLINHEGEKQHIASEAAFYTHGYLWENIRLVNEEVLDRIETGRAITN